MTKNPILNAFAAGFYIIIVGWLMDTGTKYEPKVPNLMAPIAVISLFTLSAVVMGYLFCFTPLQLYFDGKRKHIRDVCRLEDLFTLDNQNMLFLTS